MKFVDDDDDDDLPGSTQARRKVLTFSSVRAVLGRPPLALCSAKPVSLSCIKITINGPILIKLCQPVLGVPFYLRQSVYLTQSVACTSP